MTTITLRTTSRTRKMVKARFGTAAGNQGNAHLPPTSRIEWHGTVRTDEPAPEYQVFFFDLDNETEPPVWPFTQGPDGQDEPWSGAAAQSYLRVQGPATQNKQTVTLSDDAPPRIKYYVRLMDGNVADVNVAPLDPVIIIRRPFSPRLLTVIVTSVVIGAILGAIATALMIPN